MVLPRVDLVVLARINLMVLTTVDVHHGGHLRGVQGHGGNPCGILGGPSLVEHLRIHHPELPGHELHLENDADPEPGADKGCTGCLWS